MRNFDTTYVHFLEQINSNGRTPTNRKSNYGYKDVESLTFYTQFDLERLFKVGVFHFLWV